MIERRKRAHAARHYRHRMGIAPEALVEPAHLLVHHRMMRDASVEVGFLRGGGKFPIQQEIAGLEKVAVLRKLCDRIAAVEENAFLAIDKRDFGVDRKSVV